MTKERKEEIIQKIKKVIKKEEPDVTIEEVQEAIIMKKKVIKILIPICFTHIFSRIWSVFSNKTILNACLI